MGVLDFLGAEAGQRRRRALDELGRDIAYYLPPEIRPIVGLLAESTPTATLERAGRASERMLDPDRTARQRVGDLGEMLSETAGVVAPAAVASRAAMPAAQAIQEGLLGMSVPARAAGQAVIDRANQPGPVPTMYSNVPVRATMGPEERIAASTPASWRDPKFEKPQWHPISSTSMTTPASDIRVATEDLGVLSPSRNISIEDLQGRVLTPALGDRTIAGVNITGYDDIAFGSPVRSQGGRDFMREEGTGLWASEYTPMSRKAKAVQGLLDRGEDPALVYTAMGAQAGDFSTIMMDAVMNQFDATKISADAAKKFDDRMAKLKIKGWPGTKSGKVGEALAEMPGSSRWAVWQEMDKASYRDAGFPDIGKTRVSITDPELLDVDPFAAGLNIGRPQGLLTNELFTPHPSYEYQIGGNYEGGIGNMPGQLIWRDFFEGRRASGAAPAGDQRAFMMQSPSMTQRVDQQMIDEVSEYLRRLEQGQ